MRVGCATFYRVTPPHGCTFGLIVLDDGTTLRASTLSDLAVASDRLLELGDIEAAEHCKRIEDVIRSESVLAFFRQ